MEKIFAFSVAQKMFGDWGMGLGIGEMGLVNFPTPPPHTHTNLFQKVTKNLRSHGHARAEVLDILSCRQKGGEFQTFKTKKKLPPPPYCIDQNSVCLPERMNYGNIINS